MREGEILVVHLIRLLTLTIVPKRGVPRRVNASDPDHKRKIISAVVTACIQVLGLCWRQVSAAMDHNCSIPLDPGPLPGQRIHSIFPGHFCTESWSSNGRQKGRSETCTEPR